MDSFSAVTQRHRWKTCPFFPQRFGICSNEGYWVLLRATSSLFALVQTYYRTHSFKSPPSAHLHFDGKKMAKGPWALEWASAILYCGISSRQYWSLWGIVSTIFGLNWESLRKGWVFLCNNCRCLNIRETYEVCTKRTCSPSRFIHV